MKKLVLLLLCSGFLVACSSSQYTSQVSQGNTTLISGEKLKITKQDCFEYLMDTYGASEVLKSVLTTIADKEITDQKAIDELLKEKKETYASYYDDDLLKFAQASGFKTEEEFINNQLIPEVKEELLRKSYIGDHFDKLISEYQVTRFKKIVVDKESTALEIIKASTDEDQFDKQMEKYESDSEDVDIVTKNTSALDENLIKKLKEFSQITKDGVYKDAVKLSDDSYAVIYIYDTNRQNKDEYIDSLAYDNDVKTAIESYYLKEYHFEVYDDKVKKAIQNISKDYVE